MQRDPPSFIHIHQRPPPATIAMSAESAYGTCTRQRRYICVEDCVDRRFRSDRRSLSRMRRGTMTADIGRRVGVPVSGLQELCDPSWIAVANVWRHTGDRQGVLSGLPASTSGQGRGGEEAVS